MSQPKIDSNKIAIKKQVDSPISSKISDTILVNDSAQIFNDKSNIKFIITKESSPPDDFKYIFPIITLLLGIGINKFLDFFSDRKKIKRSGERWKAELQCLTNPIQHQILALEIFRNEHLKEIWQIPELEIQTILKCEIFKSLDKADLIKYIRIINKKKYDEAVLTSNKVHGFISILESNYDLLQKKFDDYFTATTNHTNSFNKNLKKLMRAFADYQVELEIELKKDVTHEANFAPISKVFDFLIIKNIISGLDDIDIYDLKQNFFSPLASTLANFRHDQRTVGMIDGVSNCLINIKDIEMEKKYLSQNLIMIASSYDKQAKELSDIISDFQS